MLPRGGPAALAWLLLLEMDRPSSSAGGSDSPSHGKADASVPVSIALATLTPACGGLSIGPLSPSFQMLTDLNTYLNKAIPDTRLTIKKYLDVKFEYLVSGLRPPEGGRSLWSGMREWTAPGTWAGPSLWTSGSGHL